MGSRETILQTIASNKPPFVGLPSIDLAKVIQYEDNLFQFIKVHQTNGGNIIHLNNEDELLQAITYEKETGNIILDLREKTESNEFLNLRKAYELDSLYKCYLRGSLGVAENGSVWVREGQMRNRLVPFICQHLAIILNPKDIVATMHHAYQKINANGEGFGVFIAGPSKTADIEQNLVIGAHGARTVTVYLIGNSED